MKKTHYIDEPDFRIRHVRMNSVARFFGALSKTLGVLSGIIVKWDNLWIGYKITIVASMFATMFTLIEIFYTFK